MKKPWRDGTVALLLEPLDLIARVCALIPPPRFHMVRYHGVLSSHAKVRSEVVPHPEQAAAAQLALFGKDTGVLEVLALEREPRRKPWAWLLRHVFNVDVSTCVRCGGVTRWLEAATTPEAIARVLAKHRQGARPPPEIRPKAGQLRLAFRARERRARWMRNRTSDATCQRGAPSSACQKLAPRGPDAKCRSSARSVRGSGAGFEAHRLGFRRAAEGFHGSISLGAMEGSRRRRGTSSTTAPGGYHSASSESRRVGCLAVRNQRSAPP